jgi:hypothetical protein
MIDKRLSGSPTASQASSLQISDRPLKKLHTSLDFYRNWGGFGRPVIAIDRAAAWGS